MIAILGGGIAGISAGYHAALRGLEHTVFEKNNTWGGLCDNFTIGNGFRFDYFIHLSFTQSEYVKSLFSKSSKYITHKSISKNYYKGYWLKHPAQNNLAPLSIDEKVKIITDFINRPQSDSIKNYKEWLRCQFGNYFAANFSEIYTKKYWTVDAAQLTTDWLGNRFSLPPLESLLKGAFKEQDENFYYAQEMRYPIEGGYKAFLNKMVSQIDIALNKEAILIDPQNKQVEFSDGTREYYSNLISSIPLPELVKMIKDCPSYILDAANDLVATSGQLVSIGFNRPDIPKYLWAYIYDEDIFPARVYSPSLKSVNNVPEGKSSLQFETYYSKYSPKKLEGDDIISHVISNSEQMNIFSKNDIELVNYREVKYANVVFDHKRETALTAIHAYLQDVGIMPIGRFGEWDYLWSDQSLLSGMKGVNDYQI
jgi:protoporphyrinogen oxidase